MDFPTNAFLQSGDEFQDYISEQLAHSKGLLKEIILTLDQSQIELSRLTQKKASITAQLQRVQSNLESTTRAEIKDTYNEALDSQQRLLVMRGQMDKLQEQRSSLENYVNHLEKVKKYLEEIPAESPDKSDHPGGLATLEMLITAQEAERQRLSRQMHDGPAQALSNFIVQAEIATKLFDMEPSKARDELDKLKSSAMNTFQKVRVFITDLRPMMLDDLGLVPTVRKYISSLKDETGVDVSITINGSDKQLEPYLDVYIFRSIQEMVGNSIKHNQNNSGKMKVDVILNIENTRVLLNVHDNGKGFDVKQVEESGGLGLKLIRERAEMLGGSLNINADVDRGVDVTLEIPVTEIPAV
jgi:two-component system sensor histidine kinase DegS